MSNHYETVFILTPVLSDAQVKESVESYEQLLIAGGCEIVQKEIWGLKKLAYPITKKSTGFYNLIEFSCNGEIIKKLETEYKRDEKIMRFLTVKLDKFAVQYTEKKRNKGKEIQKSAE
ncbi:MAG: 30S ribosomal protein S6 [Bacteroidales bacterium]|nr:30S ribosomal protein S6 [Bacteroidales bacterium]